MDPNTEEKVAQAATDVARTSRPIVIWLSTKWAALLASIAHLLQSHCATLWAALGYLYNKAPIIAILWYATHAYLSFTKLHGNEPHGIPFIELWYAAILISAVGIAAPLLRLLVFPEVARYAESGQINADLYGTTGPDGTKIPAPAKATTALIHYWIVTPGCYAVCTIVLAVATQFGR